MIVKFNEKSMKSKKTHDYLVVHFMVETRHAYKKNPLFWMPNSNLIQYKLELKSLSEKINHKNLKKERKVICYYPKIILYNFG